ncbi:MAG: amidohydrolase family protein [Gammaproteobacteria bacterium]|nr:amidohydrolase family protein [Gammaproteobacteria bacterium]
MFRNFSCGVVCLLVFNVIFAQPAVAKTLTVVHAGTLLAVPGEPPKLQQTIVMADNVVTQVLDGFVDPASIDANAELIDLSDLFVLPGLMDMHVHLLMELGSSSRADVLTTTSPLAAMRGAQFAKRTLLAGFTTVRDLGGDPEAIYALREAIERGYVPGPRIFAAGSSIAATGGHGDVDGVTPELMQLWTPATICDGPYDCRRATRYAIKHGADWIKITATGGVLSDSATGLELQMAVDELEEIMTTAHSLGRKVAAHAHGTAGINAALRAGVDSIDHGTFLDKESVRLFKRTGAYFVPTMLPGHLVKNSMEGNPFFTPAIREKVFKASGASKASVKLAYDGGVKIAFGTDTGVTKHGSNAEEFALLVDAGMSEMDVIRAATVVTAELLERSDELGTIEPGKTADMIAVSGNPLEEISVLEDVKVVIKNGQLVR